MKLLKPSAFKIDAQFHSNTTSSYEKAGFFVFLDDSLLVLENTVSLLSFDQLPSGIDFGTFIYAGSVKSKPIYVGSIDQLETAHDAFQSVALWSLLDEPGFDFQLAGRAKQLLNWDKTHRFCGRCGAPNESPKAGIRGTIELVKICTRCDLRAYPRLSPCVIVLVYRGDKILLAQRPGSSHGYYTVQAGFIEAGESAEQAVIREIKEETDLDITDLTYFASQPWPFPGQLMLGYFAESAEGEVKPDLEELENTDWFDYRDLPLHPGSGTISGQLIQQFVAERKKMHE